MCHVRTIYHVTKRKTDNGQKSGYYATILNGISLCTDIAHEKKITGLPQIWILTLSLLNLTSANFCIQDYTRATTPENMQHIKRTSKHAISRGPEEKSKME